MTDQDADLDAFANRRLGTVLRGKYRLDRVLGIGGMAVVYKATHRNQAEFAVKILHPELSGREDVKTRFLREGYAANSVKHPGAVLVVDDDTAEDGAAFLVMELLEGDVVESLAERTGGRVPIRAAVLIVSQLLDVLAAAHSKGIIHRDIKPANLLVMKDGTLKVLDFGIARARDAALSGGHATSAGLLLGTPAFMPPEQAHGKVSEIDGRTDVWAVGATLFTLISGHLVHEGETAPELMIRAATTPARHVATVAPDTPPPIASVIDHALAFDKASRWPSAEAMRHALDGAYISCFGHEPSKAALVAALRQPDVAFATTARAGTPIPASDPGSGGLPPTRVSPNTGPNLYASTPTPTPAHGGGAPGAVTTAQAIVSSQHPSIPGVRTSGRTLAAVLAVAFSLALLTGAVLVWRAVAHREVVQEVEAGGLVMGTAPADPSTATPTPNPTATPNLNPNPTPNPPSAPPPNASASASAHPIDAAPPPRFPPATATATATGSAKKPNCDPNFYLDAQGRRRFKPECF